MNPQVVLITGASSGFGAMTALALARSGHRVYASMREIYWRGRMRAASVILERLAALEPLDADPGKVAEAIVHVVAMPHGRRPCRVHIDPSDDGSDVVNAVADRVRAQFYERIGFADLLRPKS